MCIWDLIHNYPMLHDLTFTWLCFKSFICIPTASWRNPTEELLYILITFKNAWLHQKQSQFCSVEAWPKTSQKSVGVSLYIAWALRSTCTSLMSHPTFVMLCTNLYSKWILLPLSIPCITLLQFLPSWKLLLLLKYKCRSLFWPHSPLLTSQKSRKLDRLSAPIRTMSFLYPLPQLLLPTVQAVHSQACSNTHGFNVESSSWASQRKQDTGHKLPQLWRAQLTGITHRLPKFAGCISAQAKPSRILSDRNMHP